MVIAYVLPGLYAHLKIPCIRVHRTTTSEAQVEPGVEPTSTPHVTGSTYARLQSTLAMHHVVQQL